MKRPIADDAADAVVEVDARSEAHVDAHGAQLRGHQPAALPGELSPGGCVEIVFAPDRAHRRQDRETLAKALYAAAFMIDGDEHRRVARGADVRDQALELLDALEIAREQDDASHQRMREQLAILLGEAMALHIDHQGAEGHLKK